MDRQPNHWYSQTISGAEMMAPTAAPELATPFRKALSFGGYHSEVARADAMKLPGSPIPSRMRKMLNSAAVRAKAWSTLLIDHHTMNVASARRVPQRSTRMPDTRYMTV